jgi:hypothetical protein
MTKASLSHSKGLKFNTETLSVDIRQNYVNIKTHVKMKSAI